MEYFIVNDRHVAKVTNSVQNTISCYKIKLYFGENKHATYNTTFVNNLAFKFLSPGELLMFSF